MRSFILIALEMNIVQLMGMFKNITLLTSTCDYGKNLMMMCCAMEHHLLVDDCWMELQMVGTNAWGILMQSGKQLVITKSSEVLTQSLDFYCGILSSNISISIISRLHVLKDRKNATIICEFPQVSR